MFRLADHLFHLLDAGVAFVEALRDVLGKPLDLGLLCLFGVVIVEPREHMLLVKLVEAVAFRRNVGQYFGNLICYVCPARWQYVHLNHGVAIVLESRQETSGVLGRIASAGKGIAVAFCVAGTRRTSDSILKSLSRVMGV